MELRGFREKDRGPLARMAATALGGSVGEWEENYTPGSGANPRLDLDRVRVVEEDGEVRATAAVLPLEVFVDGKPAPMGGIADVATHPAYRRRGYAGDLMRAALGGMREDGIHLSMLMPFAHAYYRRYGWELATEAVSYTVNPGELPASGEQRNLRAYREEDLSRIMALLEGEASGYPVSVRRGKERWREILSREGTGVAVYERDGIEGYVLYRQSTDWDRTPPRRLTLSEVVAETPEAREALLSFAAAYDPQVFEVRYKTPRGEPLHPYLANSYVAARVSPEMMLRLVDVEGALGLLDRKLEEPLVLTVADDTVPENAGSYTVGDGVTRGAEGAEAVSLDVRQLAQLYAGYLPVRWMVRRGLVGQGSPRALELLDALFPTGDPWVFPQDHF